jgi:hypothetical protein
MGERKQIVPLRFRSKSNVDENFHLKLDIKRTAKTLPFEHTDATLNVAELFTRERNTSECYRFNGEINVIASNVLFNWDGENSFEDIIDKMDYDTDTGEYVNSQAEILKEKDGWFYYNDENSSCDRIYLEPIPYRFSPLNLSGDTNWELWLTYPDTVNIKQLSFNSVPLSDGIAIFSGTTILIDDRVMTVLICPINHGLVVGDNIVISSQSSTGFEGTHTVYALGFGDGTYESNAFIVDLEISPFPNFSTSQTSLKRTFNGTVSKYFARWFRKISRIDEPVLYKTAFARNIYNDQVYSFDFPNSFDLSLYEDYLNRELTEVYFTLIKRQDVNPTAFWTNVQSGLKTAVLGSDYDINLINTTSLITTIEDVAQNNSEYLFGDIIEYNEVSQTEIVLEVAYHRVNSLNRENNNFLEGYFYKPHYKQQIKKFSNYVQTKFSTDNDVPDYATVLPDGRAIWRDILPNDFSNSEQLPFVNGCHYAHSQINLILQRQNPCNLFDLGNPNPVIGICNLDTQLEEVQPENICE